MTKNIVKFEGFADLQAKIRKLGNDKDKKREVLSILRNVANSTVKAARVFAPKSKQPHIVSGSRARKVIQPGALKKSIGKITGRKGASKKNPTIYVGPRAKGKHDGFYGAWVHEGHNIYRTGFKRKRSGNSRYNARGAKRQTTKNPFMDKAYNATKGGVTAEAEKRTVKFIQRRINRLSN